MRRTTWFLFNRKFVIVVKFEQFPLLFMCDRTEGKWKSGFWSTGKPHIWYSRNKYSCKCWWHHARIKNNNPGVKIHYVEFDAYVEIILSRPPLGKTSVNHQLFNLFMWKRHCTFFLSSMISNRKSFKIILILRMMLPQDC